MTSIDVFEKWLSKLPSNELVALLKMTIDELSTRNLNENAD